MQPPERRREALFIEVDQKLTNIVKIPCVVPALPSPILLKRKLTDSKNSFDFYNGQDFLKPPFTQEDR